MKSNSTIVNLAILETIRSRSSGFYLDHFLPILAKSLEHSTKTEINDEDVQAILKNDLDIHVPVSTARLLALRAKRKKLFTQQSGLYILNHEKIQELALKFKKKAQESEIAQNELFKDIVRFAKERYDLDITDDDVSVYFGEYLSGYQLDLLKKMRDEDTKIEMKSKNENSDFLINSYIAELIELKSSFFNHLETTFRGYMLASFLTMSPAASGSSNLSKMKIFIDTPILMGLFGFDGPSRQSTLREMIDLIKGLKGQLKVFQHTYNEWEGVFDAWSAALKSGNTKNMNPATFQLLLEKKMDFAAIDSLIPRLKEKLRKLNIEVEDRPPNDTAALAVDEDGLKKHLLDAGFNDRGKRLDRDIDSVTSIYRLRKGVSRVTLANQPPIFITNNTLLCSQMKYFFEEYIDHKSLPLIAGDVWITNLCWMLDPRLFPNLPRKIIVSNCYGALFQDDKMWQNFLHRCERLQKEGKISEEELSLVQQERQFMITAKEIEITEGSDYDDKALLNKISETKNKIFAEKDKEILNLSNRLEGVNHGVEDFCQKCADIASWALFGLASLILIGLGVVVSIFISPWVNLIGLLVFGLIPYYFNINLLRERQVLSLKIKQVLIDKVDVYLQGEDKG